MPPRLLASADHVVSQDHGQFHLVTSAQAFDADDLVELIEAAQAADGIAQGTATVVVLVPHQNNFAMPLTVERWDARPGSDIQDWQDVAEVSLHVDDSGLIYDNTRMLPTDLNVPSGHYRAEISGRGFVNRGWPGSTTPGDVWRIRLWPDPQPSPPHRIARWSG